MKLCSLFDPPSNNASLKVFSQSLRSESRRYLNKTKKGANISKIERDALNNLAADTTITIRPADKDPTVEFGKTIFATLQRGVENHYITRQEFEYLHETHPRCPVLYTLPKVHKDPIHPTGRPIVSAIGGLLEPIGKWLDKIFKTPVLSLPTCVKDSAAVIERLNNIPVPVAYTQ
ncbi:Hypothetical predicted protein [Pelobates cultripes]|uniref:Uncharacterized protein n=1 Tax=Pelobates cultripes TaxID=61616 RepID=A0AAD1T2L1_PELCU|nr:Hypothetical predicted protein [Pelobates cultripes]